MLKNKKIPKGKREMGQKLFFIYFSHKRVITHLLNISLIELKSSLNYLLL